MAEAANGYDSSSIKTLSPLMHIRHRPGMYIGRLGDGSHPDDGIYVLVKEIIDNCIDEFTMGVGKRIDITLGRDGGKLVATVRDYGQGIPEAELPFVKEKFYKGSSKQRGSGIGLAVTEEIVALHGGTLDIASAVGEGTTVTVTLPSAKAEEALGITGAPSRTEEEP